MGRVLGALPVRWWLIGLGAVLLMLLLLAAPVVIGLSALFRVSSASQSASHSPVSQPALNAHSGMAPPSSLIPVYQAAGAHYNVSWNVLAAINYVETAYAPGPVPPNSAGAEGPMQFEPPTWALYGVSAPGHTPPPNIQNVPDAIWSAAHYLSASGFAANPRQAIYSYNHAWWYVNEVLADARQIAAKKTGGS